MLFHLSSVWLTNKFKSGPESVAIVSPNLRPSSRVTTGNLRTYCRLSAAHYKSLPFYSLEVLKQSTEIVLASISVPYGVRSCWLIIKIMSDRKSVRDFCINLTGKERQDLSPRDYFLFPPLKDDLREVHTENEQYVEDFVCNWLMDDPTSAARNLQASKPLENCGERGGDCQKMFNSL